MLLTPTAPDARIRSRNYSLTGLTGIGLTSCTGAEAPAPVMVNYRVWTQVALPASSPAENPIAELRRRSGLTWEQCAQVMGVERRTLHFWEAGRGMRPVHEERLQRLLQVVRRADRGSAMATRVLLLDASQGVMLKDLLAEGRLEEAWARVAEMPSVPAEPRPSPLEPEVRASRRDLPLAERLDLRDDPVMLPPAGPAKPARVTRVGRR
jgi:DNA-binding transcriptional regulator YiaG